VTLRRLGTLVFASAAITSCGQTSGRPPQLTDEGNLDGGHPAGDGHDAGTGTDAGPLTDAGPDVEAGAPAPGALAVTDGGPCAALVPTTLVTQQQVAAPTPQVIGGNIAPGTYVLTSMNKYTGTGGATGPTTKVQAEVWAVDSSSYQHAVSGATPDGGLNAPSLDSGYYTAKNNTFLPSAKCGIGNIPVSYSVAGSVLKLSFLNEEYVFTRQP
jgi:hypothetical protein